MTKTADHTPVSHISRMADCYVTNLDLDLDLEYFAAALLFFELLFFF